MRVKIRCLFGQRVLRPNYDIINYYALSLVSHFQPPNWHFIYSLTNNIECYKATTTKPDSKGILEGYCVTDVKIDFSCYDSNTLNEFHKNYIEKCPNDIDVATEYIYWYVNDDGHEETHRYIYFRDREILHENLSEHIAGEYNGMSEEDKKLHHKIRDGHSELEGNFDLGKKPLEYYFANEYLTQWIMKRDLSPDDVTINEKFDLKKYGPTLKEAWKEACEELKST